jgi:hypothetical protein
MNKAIVFLKADISEKLARLRARRSGLPSVGQRIEFLSDRFSDKGPATGTVSSVDGTKLTVKFADEEQSFLWRDLRDAAQLTEDGLWMIKAHPAATGWREPTPAQAEAGNYRKPVVRWNGLDIAIENPAGTVRRGNGWETRMIYDYGYVKRSEAVDGDEVDVYLGPNLENAPMVYVVHQRKYGDWDAYDEDKCMLGFDSEDDASAAYLQHYDDARFLGPITAMPVAEFVEKVRATRDKPAMIKGVGMSQMVMFLKAHGKPPAPGKVVNEDGEDKIVENLDGLIGEHEHLVAVLDKDKDPAAQQEAREEGAELDEFKRKKKAADKGAPMSKAIVFLKAAKLSDSLRRKIGTVGSSKRQDEPEGVFLEPGERKYPVKIKEGDKWVYSPKLLEAAAAEARMHGHEDIAKRADEIRAGL